MSPSQFAPGKVGKARTTAAALRPLAGRSLAAPQATNSATAKTELGHRRQVLDLIIASRPPWLVGPRSVHELQGQGARPPGPSALPEPSPAFGSAAWKKARRFRRPAEPARKCHRRKPGGGRLMPYIDSY